MKRAGALMNRRVLVGGGIAAAALLAYAAAIGRGAAKACGPDAEQAALDIAALHSLIRIGEAYLQADADSAEIAALREEWLETVNANAPGASRIERRIAVLDRKAVEEFERGETVLCDGWLIARCEARFCAMLAISARRSWLV